MGIVSADGKLLQLADNQKKEFYDNWQRKLTTKEYFFPFIQQGYDLEFNI